jgi:hypothetical protein
LVSRKYDPTVPGPFYRRRLLQEIMVCWAGAVAEKLFADSYPDDEGVGEFSALGSWDDMTAILGYAGQIDASDRTVEDLRDWTDELLAPEMAAITAVASWLESKTCISGQLLAVILDDVLS